MFYLYRTIQGIENAKAYGLAHDAGHGYSGFSTENWVNQPLLSNYEKIMSARLDAYEQRLNILCKKVKSFGHFVTNITTLSSIRKPAFTRMFNL